MAPYVEWDVDIDEGGAKGDAGIPAPTTRDDKGQHEQAKT